MDCMIPARKWVHSGGYKPGYTRKKVGTLSIVARKRMSSYRTRFGQQIVRSSDGYEHGAWKVVEVSSQG